MFTEFPTYDRYRTLRLTNPMQKGEDVYALQTALGFLQYDVGISDGVLGPRTAVAIRDAQKDLALEVDGLCGGATQQALAMACGKSVRMRYQLPNGLLYGQLAHESGFRLGNYSPIRSNGSYDAGVAQQNTEHTEASVGFNVPVSILSLGKQVADHWIIFEGLKPFRRWSLAQGSWNAPAFACYIAKEEGATRVPVSKTAHPSDASRATFEAYVASVSSYLTV
jgi:peptidoglycan hydrolase-like protein with peptidoglycan-binding domain